MPQDTATLNYETIKGTVESYLKKKTAQLLETVQFQDL